LPNYGKMIIDINIYVMTIQITDNVGIELCSIVLICSVKLLDNAFMYQFDEGASARSLISRFFKICGTLRLVAPDVFIVVVG